MNNKTPAFLIFHKWWGFLLPHHAVISKYDSEVVGLYTFDDKKQIRDHLSQDTYCVLTIAKACEYIKKGIMPKVATPEDAVAIYETIMHHLIGWYNFLANDSLVNRDVPIEGLSELANFAGMLFPIANRRGYCINLEIHTNGFEEDMDMLTGTGKHRQGERRVKSNHHIIGEIERLNRKRNKRNF